MKQSAEKYTTVSQWPLIQIRALRQKYPKAFADYIETLTSAGRRRVMLITNL